MSFENGNIEQKQFHILKVLESSPRALGSRVIAARLKDLGIRLEERAVRYHLKLLDEKGLTRLVRARDGRIITESGQAELKRAMVNYKVGLALSKMEAISYRASFDPDSLSGLVPVNISFFPEHQFDRALKSMKPAFEAGFCVSALVLTAASGESIGDFIVPDGITALATVCCLVINGVLLRSGVPVDSRFGGVLQIEQGHPQRFVELIHYSGSSLDPSEIFIRAGMTGVNRILDTDSGELLANFREIPAVCLPVIEDLSGKLARAGISGIIAVGDISEPVCEIPVDVNRCGVVLTGGLNPVAAARERGFIAENYAMSTLVDYKKLVPVTDICR